MKILLIEDDETLLSLTEMIITERFPGAEVTCHTDGDKAWKSLQEQQDSPYRLIISDYNMPGMSGLDFLELIKSKLSYRPHFCLLSGDISNFENVNYDLDKFTSLQKPCEEEEILNIINRIT